jgi:hypothetical protein
MKIGIYKPVLNKCYNFEKATFLEDKNVKKIKELVS